jgi:hypothetical protein
LFAVSTIAADITVKWDASQGADGYSLSQSIDNGQTWSTPQDVGNVLTFLYPVPNSGLTLVKVGAYNNTGITWRLDAGVFYNGDWKPLAPPGGVGIQ